MYVCIFQDEEGPDIRGGSIDALIVHAAAAAKSGEYCPVSYMLLIPDKKVMWQSKNELRWHY